MQAKQTAAIGQIVQELLDRLARRANQRRQGEWIEISNPIVMREAGLRAHAETVRLRFALLDCTKRTAAAEMARDDARLRIAQKLARPLRDVAMAGAVKAPALNAMFFGPFQGHGIAALGGRNRLVKPGLERRDERSLRKLIRRQPSLSHISRVF